MESGEETFLMDEMKIGEMGEQQMSECVLGDCPSVEKIILHLVVHHLYHIVKQMIKT